MRIQLISDIHWDQDPAFRPRPVPGADMLVLAGDIASRHFPGDPFGLAAFSPLRGWPTPVFYVPGNHEYDGGDYDQTRLELQQACHRHGITWLDRMVVVAGGIRWVGDTLWADFDALVEPGDDAWMRREKRRKAMRAADFYLPRMAMTRSGQPMLARPIRGLARQSRQWLTEILAQPFDGPTVVVSHFAPSLLSADPRYGLVPGTAGFCNAWDHLLPGVALWLHGHLHCANDYVRHGCRVVANPVGYPKAVERDAYRPNLLIETH